MTLWLKVVSSTRSLSLAMLRTNWMRVVSGGDGHASFAASGAFCAPQPARSDWRAQPESRRPSDESGGVSLLYLRYSSEDPFPHEW